MSIERKIMRSNFLLLDISLRERKFGVFTSSLRWTCFGD